MIYSLINILKQKSTTLKLPCNETKIQQCCDELGIKNDMFAQAVVVGKADDTLYNILSGTACKLDELNFLEKRLDSFGDDESNTFMATAIALKYKSLKDLINLSFNTDCYSLLADISDLNKLGKELYLNEHGSANTDFLNEFDGQKYVIDMTANNLNFHKTSYGSIYPNSNVPQQLYNGRCFPNYHYEANPITVSLKAKRNREYLYLPCEKTEIDKALQRLHCTKLSDVDFEVINHLLPKNISDIIFQNTTDIDHLNEIAAKLKKINISDYGQFTELVKYKDISTSFELNTLLEDVSNIKDWNIDSSLPQIDEELAEANQSPTMTMG